MCSVDSLNRVFTGPVLLYIASLDILPLDTSVVLKIHAHRGHGQLTLERLKMPGGASISHKDRYSFRFRGGFGDLRPPAPMFSASRLWAIQRSQLVKQI